MTNLVKLESKTPKEVKELLQEWLENEDLEEIFLLGKIKGKIFRWDHSFISSTFWWMGCLTHIRDLLSGYQMEDE